MEASDGKKYLTDVADVKTLLRIIRLGLHELVVTNAFVNHIPSLASRSMLGVLISEFI